MSVNKTNGILNKLTGIWPLSVSHKPARIIVEMKSGMCNQMFDYALYLSLKKQKKSVKVYEREIKDKYGNILKPMRLPEVFGVHYECADETEMLEMQDRVYIESSKNLNFDPKVFQLDNVYLQGYWQTEKYFSDPKVQKQLRHDFRCPRRMLKQELFKRWYLRIKTENSVSLHIRRTDYLVEKHIPIYGGICTEEYYEKAIAMIRERVPDVVIYVFSDDKAYIHEHYSQPGFIIVDEPGFTDAEEFFLMSACHHHILAHSSFSWWAAWLTGEKDSVVLVPDKWINGKIMDDIYTDRMIKVKGV